METSGIVDRQGAITQRAGQHVAAAGAVLIDKMQMITRHVEPLHERRSPEAHQGTLHPLVLKRGLGLDNLNHRLVGLGLPGYAAGLDEVKLTLYPDGVETIFRRNQAVDSGTKLFETKGTGDRNDRISLEVGDSREGRTGRVWHTVSFTIGFDLEYLAVQLSISPSSALKVPMPKSPC